MKKVSILFAALFVSAMVLTSCGGASTEATTDSTAVETPAVEEAPAVDSSAAAAADTTQVAQ